MDRLRASERVAAMRLAICRAILKRGIGDLDKRAATIPGCKRDLALCTKLIDKNLVAIKDTLPAEQGDLFEQSLAGVTYELMTRCPATSHNDKKWAEENGMWLPFNVINALFDGAREKCMMCSYDTEGQRRCALRKALNVIPHDIEHSGEDEGKCPYYTIM